MKRKLLIQRTSWDPGFRERIQVRNRAGFDLGFVDVSDDGRRFYPYSNARNVANEGHTGSLLSACHVIAASHRELRKTLDQSRSPR